MPTGIPGCPLASSDVSTPPIEIAWVAVATAIVPLATTVAVPVGRPPA
jgi:hypothetical protein